MIHCSWETKPAKNKKIKQTHKQDKCYCGELLHFCYSASNRVESSSSHYFFSLETFLHLPSALRERGKIKNRRFTSGNRRDLVDFFSHTWDLLFVQIKVKIQFGMLIDLIYPSYVRATPFMDAIW